MPTVDETGAAFTWYSVDKESRVERGPCGVLPPAPTPTPPLKLGSAEGIYE